jgi:hypothetical protein
MSSVNQFKDTIIYGNFQNKDNYKAGGNICNAIFDRSITVGLTGYFKNSIGVTGDANVYGNIKGNTGFFNNGLGVTGNINASNSLIVGSTGYFNNSIGVTGNVNISNTLSVGSTGYFNIIGVTGSIKLPNNQVINTTTPTLLTSNSSISDSQLSSNVCLLDATPSFTSTPKFYNGYTVYSGGVGSFLDSTNTNSTQISQYNNDCYMINYTSNGTIFINSSIVNLLSGSTWLKGGTNALNYNTHFPYSNGTNYISGNTNLRLGNVNVTDGLLTCSNGLTVSGALTLPSNSVSDSALSSNVVQLTSSQVLTNKTLTDCIGNTQLSADNSTKIATTAFVKSLGYLTAVPATYALLNSPTFTGTPLAPTALSTDNSTQIATTAFVKSLGYLTAVPATYALLNSPTFTGTPLAPTAISTDNSTQIATTAFVKSLGYLTAVPATYALLNSPTFTGTPLAPTAISTDNSTKIATTAFVKSLNYLTSIPATYALLNSPTFTGTPLAPTALSTDNSTQIATTAFVKSQNYLTAVPSTYALLNSPTFTGTPLAPTALSTDNSTQIATTAFVKSQNYLTAVPSTYALLNSPTFTGTPLAPTALSTDNSTQIATTAFVKSQNYLTSSSSINDSQLSSNIPKLNISNTFNNTTVFNATTTFQSDINSNANINTRDLILSGRIQLQQDYTTYPINSNLYLGYIQTGSNVATFTLANNGTYNLCSITLGSGVWMITGHCGVINTHVSATPVVTSSMSLSSTSATLDNACLVTDQTTYNRNTNFVKELTRYISNTTSGNITYYLVIKTTFSSGTIEFNASASAYTNLTAVRIA